MNRGAQKVKKWRKAQRPRMTQEDFARLYGLTAISWSRIERGQWLPGVEQVAPLQRDGIADAEDWLTPALDDHAAAAIEAVK